MKRSLFIALVIVLAMVAIWAGRRAPSKGSGDIPTQVATTQLEGDDTVNSMEKSKPSNPKSELKAAARDSENSGAGTPAVTQLPALKEVTPKLETIREEVAADPHVTPKSFLEFSLSLGERMSEAEKSETAAREFLTELETCITSPDQERLHNVQALCLLNARRLSEKYPSLESQYSSINRIADPEAVRLSKMVN